jgi:ABC-type multidrug transport system ATPase subunit
LPISSDLFTALIEEPAPGAGLSIEQRKRVTLGVELVAKPTLLFLDEPTSGLDGQSAFNIVRFMRRLVDGGQAVLCTIHQPSAVLFDAFDSLLLLAKGGHMAYFGESKSQFTTLCSLSHNLQLDNIPRHFSATLPGMVPLAQKVRIQPNTSLR